MCKICNQPSCAALCPNNMQTDVIYCSVCGEAMGDTAYYDAAGQLVGCENCITAKDPYR